MNEKEYQTRLNDVVSILNELKIQSNKISNYRLTSFVGFLVSFIIFVINLKFLFLVFAMIFLSIFIGLIIHHNKITNKINYHKLPSETLNEYLARFNNDWINFKSTGLEFNNPDLPFLLDLDILGEASLFKYLNVAVTKNGREKLVKRLSNNEFSKEELRLN